METLGEHVTTRTNDAYHLRAGESILAQVSTRWGARMEVQEVDAGVVVDVHARVVIGVETLMSHRVPCRSSW